MINLPSDLQHKLQLLEELGAETLQHTNGDLLTHLQGTYELLKAWQANQSLQDAGLFHAIYGTAGFEQAMVNAQAREKIQHIIGIEAEDIVYLYCACDRSYVWPQFTKNKSTLEAGEHSSQSPLIFRDRFAGTDSTLSDSSWQSFCELTVANEIEIAQHNSEFVAEHGDELFQVFSAMNEYLSPAARTQIASVLTATQ